jgi:hypothetical protein
MKIIKHAMFASVIALSLGACVSFGGKAPPSLLVLTAANGVPNGTAKSGASSEALIVHENSIQTACRYKSTIAVSLT